MTMKRCIRSGEPVQVCGTKVPTFDDEQFWMTSNFRARLGELVFKYRIKSGSNRRSNWDQIAEQCASVEQRVSQFRVVFDSE